MTRRPRAGAAVLVGVLAAALSLAACTGSAPAGPSRSVAPAGSAGSSASSGVVARPAAVASSPPRFPLVTASGGAVTVVDGIDWSMPSWVRPAPNSGFFSEKASPGDQVVVRSVDQAWRQLQPKPGGLDTKDSGQGQGMYFDSLDSQLAQPGPFWMRVFASGIDWAPAWVATACHVHGYGPDYDGEEHLPIWDECVWGHLLETYRALFVDRNLRADPRLRFVYVPGAFTWAEYDYETVAAAVKAGDLTFASYKKWYDHAWRDLADLFGPYRDKLVFTGEDYPFGPFEPQQQDLLAQEATSAGLGIRNGITEEFNFHLNEAPAYGSHIQPDGHLVVDETLPVHDGNHVVATENECYTDCGFDTVDVGYAVEQSNLKALQLRMNWIYVVPAQSRLDDFRPHWDWVRLELGHTAADSADAWADLRTAEDTYWTDATGPFTSKEKWRSKPFVRNLERWLVQRDVPGAVAKRATVDVRAKVFVPENGTAYEGLSTDRAHGSTALAFVLDRAFFGGHPAPVLVKVTYWDAGGAFRVQYAGGRGLTATVRPSGTKAWKTATFAVPDATFDGSLPGGTDVRIVAGSADAIVKLVRIVRSTAPSA